MPPIRLDQVNLVVRDVRASRAFYRRLGLDFGDAHDPVWDDHHISAAHGDAAAIDFDLDSMSFAHKWNQGWPGGPGAVLGFKVDTREPRSTSWSRRWRPTGCRCSRNPTTPSGAPAMPS